MRKNAAATLDRDREFRPKDLDKVIVTYRDGKRSVTCFCGEIVDRSIVKHFQTRHPQKWSHWVARFLEMRALGYPLKGIMRTFRASGDRLLFSWTVVERAIRSEIESGGVAYQPPPKKGPVVWEPPNFQLERTTVWDFPMRGDWAVHSGDYRGNWPPQIPRNLILRYTDPGDLVVDTFCGGGTTLIEAWLLQRKSIGIDLAKMAVQAATWKLQEMEDLSRKAKLPLLPKNRPRVLQGDALELLATIQSRSGAKLVCAHPPYYNSVRYSDDEKDFSRARSVDAFLEMLGRLASGVQGVLAPEGVFAILIGDVRSDGKLVPLGMLALDVLTSQGFELQTMILKTQNKERSSEFYYGRANGHLLMAHEYLAVFEKPPLPD